MAAVSTPQTNSTPEPAAPYGQFWRGSSVPGVEVMAAVNEGVTCRLLQETYTFCVVPRSVNRDGDLTTWQYRGKTHVYRPGMVGMEEPGEVHANVAVHAPTHFWLLMLDPVTCTAAREELGRHRGHFRAAQSQDPDFYRRFTAFYAAIRAGADALEVQTRFAACLRAAFEEGVEGEGALPRAKCAIGHAGLRQAIDYLHAHFAEPVQLADLARLAGVSRFHFARLFTASCGLPPHAYQTQLRLADARRQLRAGVPAVDVESGFFDVSHLTRHLKRSWCLTPGRYLAPSASGLPDWQ